ncbi:hypothetical protein [Psychroflexus tropicus]|uniref:hypothetical protein n=1 Tax=Psychroflexus tropicus TaxID=197345 RepID=UPI00037FBB8C|nr:hypothetical protein [Psychroflexus tropicus]
MEKYKLDALIKKALNESNDFYDSDAELAKERVWNKVKTEKKVVPHFYRLLSAVSILLLIFLSVLSYSNLKYKSSVEKLLEANQQLKLDNQNLQSIKDLSLNLASQRTDTVYIEKNQSETKSLVTTKFIKDTVYLKQIVYVEKDTDSLSNTSIAIAQRSDSKSEKDSKSTNATEVLSNTILKGKLIENASELTEFSANINDVKNLKLSFQKNIIIKTEEVKKNQDTKKLRIQFGRKNSKSKEEVIALSSSFSN